jgi:hypothetical protein
MTDVERALQDFVRLFDDLEVPYAVMGGLAVRAYGVPRPTYDVDVLLTVTDDQLPLLFDRVEDAGYTVPEAYRSGWVDRIEGMPLVKFRIYRPDNRSIDVDVFIEQTAYQREIMNRRQRADLSIGPVWVITPEDIVLLKLVAGRSRDMGDIEDVRFMEGDLDEAYMRHWADRLGIRDKLEQELARPPL